MVLINLKEAEEQSSTIGSIPVTIPYGITDMLIDFKKANVKINLSIIESKTERLKQKFRNDDCDLILTHRLSGQKEVTEDLNDFTVINFTTDYLVAVLPNDHPLANQALIDSPELKNGELLSLLLHSVMHNILLQARCQAGFTPSITYTEKRAENVIDLVSKGMGILLLMVKPISYINMRNLVKLVPVPPYIETEIVIYCKKSALLSKTASYFLELVQR